MQCFHGRRSLYYPLAESSYHFLMCSSTVKGPRRKTNDYAIGFRSFKQRKGSEHSVFMYSPGYLLSLKDAEGRDTRYKIQSLYPSNQPWGVCFFYLFVGSYGEAVRGRKCSIWPDETMNNRENTKKRVVEMFVGSNYVVVIGQFYRVVKWKGITLLWAWCFRVVKDPNDRKAAVHWSVYRASRES